MSSAHAERLRALISTWQPRFRNLEDWTIVVDEGDEYTCQICYNNEARQVTMYLCPDEDVQEEDYVVHELLHVALRDLRVREDEPYLERREREERLVQDLERMILETSL